MNKEDLRASVAIKKQDDEKHMCWGWASVMTKNGKLVTDIQNDQITPEEMQKSVHDFMENSRVGAQLHMYDANDDPIQVGTIVESMVFTKELQDALGIDLGHEGWFVGYHVTNPAVWEDVKKGKLPAFSIGGTAERHPLTKSSGLAESASAIIRKLDVNKAWTEEARNAALIARGAHINDSVHSKTAFNASEQAQSKTAHADKTSGKVGLVSDNGKTTAAKAARAHDEAAEAHARASRAHAGLGGPDHRALEDYHSDMAAAHSSYADDMKVHKGWTDAARIASAQAREASKRANDSGYVRTTQARTAAHMDAAVAHHSAEKLHAKIDESETEEASPATLYHARQSDIHTDKANPHVYDSKTGHLNTAWGYGAQSFERPPKGEVLGDMKSRGYSNKELTDAGKAYDSGKTARLAAVDRYKALRAR